MTTEQKTLKNCHPVVALRPKAKIEAAFVYRNPDDLKSLIPFVGIPATLTANMEVQFKRTVVKPGSVVFRDEYGNTRTMTIEEASARFDLVADKEFTPSDANKVISKTKSEPKK